MERSRDDWSCILATIADQEIKVPCKVLGQSCVEMAWDHLPAPVLFRTHHARTVRHMQPGKPIYRILH
jgi:hypothetical protein